MRKMLASIAIVAPMFAVVAPAAAQRGPAAYPGNPVAPSSTSVTNCCFSQAAGAFPVTSIRDQAPDPNSVCLQRKSTGARVCHTRKEWEQIAAKMGEGKTPG